MNKKLILGLLAILVVGGGIYFLTAKKSQDQVNTTNDNQTTTQEQLAQTPEQKKSLKDLIASGTQKCEYSDGVNKTVVYTDNGKSKIESTVVANGVTMKNYAIIDGQTYYSWVDGQSTGVKFSVNQSGTATPGSNQGVDLNGQFNYNCNRWSVDNSVFILPSNIQFTDYSSFQTGK